MNALIRRVNFHVSGTLIFLCPFLFVEALERELADAAFLLAFAWGLALFSLWLNRRELLR